MPMPAERIYQPIDYSYKNCSQHSRILRTKIKSSGVDVSRSLWTSRDHNIQVGALYSKVVYGQIKKGGVLNKLPKGAQKRAKQRLHEIWMAETKSDAEKAFDYFLSAYRAKYPKVAECLAKDQEELLAFYDFPAEH